MRRFVLSIALLLSSLPALAQPAPITPQPAMDCIFAAFRMHPLVAIGEYHGIEQELEFYAALLRDPRFACDVGNVVVEFGGAAHQDIFDRYGEGQALPYAAIRRVWTDTFSGSP